MADQRIEELKRHLEADPSDVQAQIQLIQARARVEGSSAYLGCLQDRLIWKQCSELVQDFAVKEVEERLSPDYSLLETRRYDCAGLSHRIASFIHAKSGLILNLIPGGCFIMGDDNSGYENERPAHQAKIDPLLIGRFPVRQSCWDRIGGEDEREFLGSDIPIDSVSWNECQDWLVKAGGSLRLPSEAEWEYACRGGSTTQYFWGEEMDNAYCWYSENCRSDGKQTTDVSLHFDTKSWNSFGLVDMSGHIWEWCLDQWKEHYRNGPFNALPQSGSKTTRVGRGGGWRNFASSCRSAYRFKIKPSKRRNVLGFRVARSLSL